MNLGKNLAKALFEFQSKAPKITKDAKAHSYKYADLPSVKEAVEPILQECGLVVSQPLASIDGENYVRTIVTHVASGESVDSLIKVDTVKLAGQNEYQSLGSGITYLRRYSYESILGIVTTKDDDAGGANSGAKGGANPSKQKLSPSSPKWANAIAYLKGGGTVEEGILKFYSIIPADLSRLKKEAGVA